ncbi:tetratricopeptide repeat protein [Ureibacillus aquaedulcis]|uniref:Tetratricopeptide repeat protein n=1 Tax=Ureibacillus aquaedulcis TaxID=3058421 RepID=A0ABT8GN44_9BACL|nr:tetratricopeptide repeat protein [Ureibacillus sp. BA0131]MDN4492840.1 tetratricopeptide repeat protein [Ureibacillus sp. BA0131]
MNISIFKNSLEELSKILYFDQQDYLREKTTNPSKLKEYITIAEDLLKATNYVDEEYYLMGTLGNLYRIYGEPQKAINLLNRCRSIAVGDENVNREILSLIRLGEAIKYNNDPEKALVFFEEALELCRDGDSYYLDFALQHKGKCLLELSKNIEAKECFNEALKLRELKGERELIDSTLLALDFLGKMSN